MVTVAVARRVSEPLRALTREAQAIGRLELSVETVTVSRVTEVATLASSMADMKSSLRSFQKFVPADVVKDIVTSATEARLGGQRATLTLFFRIFRISRPWPNDSLPRLWLGTWANTWVR
jgi:adenylate cyclase